MDTNASISGITYPIVANDDSANVIKFFCDEFAKAITKGVQDNMKNSGVDVSSIIKKKKEVKSEENNEEASGSSNEEK